MEILFLNLVRYRATPVRTRNASRAFITSLDIALDHALGLGGADGLREEWADRDPFVADSGSGSFPLSCTSSRIHCSTRKPLVRTRERLCELEAEAVVFTVSSAIGLETGTASTDYIGLYNGDADLLAQPLDAIQHTASLIFGSRGDGSARSAHPTTVLTLNSV